MRPEGEWRLYELRLPRIADALVRDRLANVVVRRFPAHEQLSSVVRALDETGFVARVELDHREASALLRELYGAGADPAVVVLRPTDVVAHRATEADLAFGVFAQHGGGFVPTWNWRAFVFGPLWYLRKGLYGKGFVLLMVSVWPMWTLPITLLISVVVLVYCRVVGNWDHYLWKIERTQWW